MKGLVVSLPLHGHVNPTLPLVRELVERGDAISYYATDRYAAAIEESGAVYQRYRDGFLSDLSQLPSQTDELSWLLMHTAANVLEQELDRFRAEQADYIITDSVAPWGQWLGRIFAVPVVTSVSTFAINREVMAFAIAHGVRPTSARRLVAKLRHMAKAFTLQRRLCRRYGVRGPGVIASVMGSSDLNIVYTSRQFQPRADTFDDTYVFVGPMTSRTEAAEFPWERVRRSEVVYVSQGTIFNTDADFYRMCFAAFAHADFQVILSTGMNVRPESLGPAPGNFIVSSHVPQLAVLARVNAFVTHGGMNSVNESLACAVPMVVIPQMGEQALVGRQVAHLGAGICLTKQNVTADTLRESVNLVLADQRFRRNAAALRQSFQTAGGVARAADAIEAFTRRRVLQPGS